jgi:hypothetical protein
LLHHTLVAILDLLVQDLALNDFMNKISVPQPT